MGSVVQLSYYVIKWYYINKFNYPTTNKKKTNQITNSCWNSSPLRLIMFPMQIVIFGDTNTVPITDFSMDIYANGFLPFSDMGVFCGHSSTIWNKFWYLVSFFDAWRKLDAILCHVLQSHWLHSKHLDYILHFQGMLCRKQTTIWSHL